MDLREKIEQDFKQALKKKDKIMLSTLRMLKAAIYNKQIEKKNKNLPEPEIVKVISKQVQQHQDSIEHFKRGKRPELVQKEQAELEILELYLPKQLSVEEIKIVVKKIINETEAKDRADFGRVMKAAMSSFQGKANGKLVSKIVSEQLSPTEGKNK